MAYASIENYKIQVEDLIGTVGDDNIITQGLRQAGADIINAMPHQSLARYTKTAAVSWQGLSVRDFHIISVDKGNYQAKQIPVSDKTKYNDSNSIYGASDTDPVYYITNEKLYIIGNSGSGETSGNVNYVPIMPVSASDATATVINTSTESFFFPQEADHLFVIGASIYCLNHLISDAITQMKTYVNTDEDVELANAQQGIIDRYTALKQSLTQDYNLKLQIFLNQDTHERSQAREGVVA
tara:strand:- start:583 stop:1302 length:720 start_codon:yes stop_codon:yes gene_type:complete